MFLTCGVCEKLKKIPRLWLNHPLENLFPPMSLRRNPTTSQLDVCSSCRLGDQNEKMRKKHFGPNPFSLSSSGVKPLRHRAPVQKSGIKINVFGLVLIDVNACGIRCKGWGGGGGLGKQALRILFCQRMGGKEGVRG